MEWNDSKIIWPYFNGATCVTTLIWYSCVIAMCLEYDDTLVFPEVLLMVFAGARFLYARGLYKMIDEEETTDEAPPMEPEMMEMSTAMVRRL